MWKDRAVFSRWFTADYRAGIALMWLQVTCALSIMTLRAVSAQCFGCDMQWECLFIEKMNSKNEKSKWIHISQIGEITFLWPLNTQQFLDDFAYQLLIYKATGLVAPLQVPWLEDQSICANNSISDDILALQHNCMVWLTVRSILYFDIFRVKTPNTTWWNPSFSNWQFIEDSHRKKGQQLYRSQNRWK